MDFDENTQQQPDPGDEAEPTGQDIQAPEDDFASMLAASFDYEPPRRGEIREAIILQIEPNEIIVDMGAKQDGIVTSQDLERLDKSFRASLTVGESVPVYVLNPRDADGNLIVSINMGLQQHDWNAARELLDNDEVIEVTITGHNRGGILVNWRRLEGFIPSSHMVSVSAGLQGNDRREALFALEGDKVGVKVIEVDQDRRRLIFSEREAQREWRAQQKARLLAELNEGDVVSGTVTGLRDFGAFVNLGGADGLIHVSELAWHRVDHPRDVLKIGQEIEVYVLSLDRDKNRIALSRKRLLSDPWDDALERYFEGMLVEGTVTNVVDFGAFIALDDGLEGLLHLSEMGDGSLKEPHSYVKKGDRLQLRISRLEPDQRRVGFTQRWGVDQEEPLNADEPTEDAPVSETAEDYVEQVLEKAQASAAFVKDGESALDELLPDDEEIAEAEDESEVEEEAAEDDVSEAEEEAVEEIAEEDIEEVAEEEETAAEDESEAEEDNVEEVADDDVDDDDDDGEEEVDDSDDDDDDDDDDD